jgi:hypothetical protein
LLDGGRACGEGEGLLGGDGGNEGVLGEGGEVVEKGSEAVDREAVLGSSNPVPSSGESGANRNWPAGTSRSSADG